jgi:transposase
MSYFVGLDWGSAAHSACVVDSNGAVVAQLNAEHDAAGLSRLLKELGRVGPAAELPVAIERPDGLLVDTLVHAGHPIVPIHPNVLKASRPRYRAARSKSDPGDAYMLADVLRTDGHRFERLTPDSDGSRALRALVRTREDLVQERVRTTNRVRALLDTFWPGAGALFADVDSQISLAFLKRYPTPTSARRLTARQLAGFLKAHSYPGRRDADELIGRLRAAPVGLVGPQEEAAKGVMLKALVAVLEALLAQIGPLTKQIEASVTDHPVGPIMMSFPRAGKLNAAQIVAELGEGRERFQTESQLAAEAGVAPVTNESGKSRTVGFRYACNVRLRVALTLWANNSRHASEWAAHVYAKARGRGCSHSHSVRILARAWVRVLWRCWQTNQPYEAARHGAAKPFLAAA